MLPELGASCWPRLLENYGPISNSSVFDQRLVKPLTDMTIMVGNGGGAWYQVCKVLGTVLWFALERTRLGVKLSIEQKRQKYPFVGFEV